MFSVRRKRPYPYDCRVSSIEEVRARLGKLERKNARSWLAEQTGYKENSVRQYLGPQGGKGTPKFIREALRVIDLEEARQKVNIPEAPPWNVIFRTAEEFDKADRASRVAKAESLIEFCRAAILERAEGILAEKKRSGS